MLVTASYMWLKPRNVFYFFVDIEFSLWPNLTLYMVTLN